MKERQTPTGSNGVGGRDETSEDFDSTFALQDYDPARSTGGGPGPGGDGSPAHRSVRGGPDLHPQHGWRHSPSVSFPARRLKMRPR